MATLAELLFGGGVLVSLVLCLLGVYSYWRWDEPGVLSFAVFVVLFGLTGIVGGVGSLVLGTGENGDIWSFSAFTGLTVWCLPWGLFALQYSGRYTRLSRRSLAFLLVPYLLVVGGFVFSNLASAGDSILMLIAGGVIAIYVFGLLALGVGIILKTTAEYSHLSLRAGASLSAAPVTAVIGLNTANAFSTPVTVAESYLVTFAVPTVALAVALFWYDTFESTPAVGTIGEREIAREIDDLVFVVDNHGRLIKLNAAAIEVLGLSRESARGEALSTVLDHGIERFRELETVTLETTEGSRRYDTQVSTVTDQHGRELGALLSLHDVTEHNLREQRLSVLNRVLRHNLRNKVEVVKSHAEVLGQHENGHAETIVDTADAIADLGQSARAIDQFVSGSQASSVVDLGDAIRTTVSETATDDVTLSFDLPEAATVETNNEALRGALDSAIENAVAYAESAVEISVIEHDTTYEVVIADDGPGIPEAELTSLDAGTETALEHGTGLGLWQLKWAVRTMGGELGFDTSDGTTVTFTVPHQHRHPPGQA